MTVPQTSVTTNNIPNWVSIETSGGSGLYKGGSGFGVASTRFNELDYVPNQQRSESMTIRANGGIGRMEVRFGAFFEGEKERGIYELLDAQGNVIPDSETTFTAREVNNAPGDKLIIDPGYKFHSIRFKATSLEGKPLYSSDSDSSDYYIKDFNVVRGGGVS